MEKAKYLEAGQLASDALPPRRPRFSYVVATLLLLSTLYHLCYIESVPWNHRSSRNTEPELGKLIPTKCWKKSIEAPFECFYLYAPLDYLNTSDARTAKLAVVKYPAGGGKTPKEDVLGTLLINFGGPGGSGVTSLTAKGARYNNLIAAEGFDLMMRSRYHILSWDPRGIGYSTPIANCYRSKSQGTLASLEETLPHSSSSALTFNLQSNRLTSKLCAENDTLADTLRFVTTPSTARDMRLLYQASGDSKLHYWGFSYGTVLGSVFSDMFPNEVGRVALDGTVDVPDYIAGNWSTNLVDTQGTYEEGLINECVKAGEKCALNKLTNGTDLKTLLDDFYKVLIQEPMISTKTDTPFLDYSAFKGAIFSTLYSSYGWPNITKAMAEAIQGNATGFIKEFIDVESPPEPTPASPHAFVAIAGGDALERREHTWDLQDYKDLIVDLEKQSEFAGEVWSTDKSLVQTWSIVGKERHRGNFTSRTANPILFVGNDYDPVTPLLNARKMATLFPNAAVLRVKSYGHCSSSQPSKCAIKNVANYFINGTIPERKSLQADGYIEPGQVCEVDRQPWDEEQGTSLLEDDGGMTESYVRTIMEALESSWRFGVDDRRAVVGRTL